MGYDTGIDVSLEVSYLCVVDPAGKIVKEACVASEPEAMIAWFVEHCWGPPSPTQSPDLRQAG